MYKQACVMFVAVLLMGAEPTETNDPIKMEIARLQGRWVADLFEYGGQTHQIENGVQTWSFDGDRITRYVDLDKLDVVAFDVNPGETPRQLDLVPVKGERAYERGGLAARTKMIYSLADDQLKIGFSNESAPMTPEQEKQQAIKSAGIRPMTLKTSSDCGVAVIVFERAKKEPN
jgi:uncharacterized protein (TIGR03067 family)